MYQALNTVALTHDMPHAGLRRGDLGAIVEVFGLDAMEVEFVAASGRTQAVLVLASQDIRRRDDHKRIATSIGE